MRRRGQETEMCRRLVTFSEGVLWWDLAFFALTLRVAGVEAWMGNEALKLKKRSDERSTFIESLHCVGISGSSTISYSTTYLNILGESNLSAGRSCIATFHPGSST